MKTGDLFPSVFMQHAAFNEARADRVKRMQSSPGAEQVITALDGAAAVDQFVDGLEFNRGQACREAKLLQAAGGAGGFELVDLDDAQ